MKINKFKDSRYYKEKTQNMDECHKETFEHLAFFIENLLDESTFKVGFPNPETDIAFRLSMPKTIRPWMHNIVKTEISNYLKVEAEEKFSKTEYHFIKTFKNMICEAIETQRQTSKAVQINKVMNQQEMIACNQYLLEHGKDSLILNFEKANHDTREKN